MLRFRNCGLMLVVLAAAACQRSVQDERTEALEAQRSANETAAEAANERQKEVAEANREAAEDISEARREAREQSLNAVKDEIEKTSGAQANANEEAREANKTSDRDRMELTKDVERRLNKVDEKSRELHSDLDKATTDGKEMPPGSARADLAAVDRESTSIRAELQAWQGNPSQSVDQFRSRVEARLDQLEKNLERVDDEL
jgi:uncharacterized phage infection (PIP) family protein YhgE